MPENASNITPDYAADVMSFCSVMPFDEFRDMVQQRIDDELDSETGISQLSLAMINARYPFMHQDEDPWYDQWYLDSRDGNADDSNCDSTPDEDYVTDVRSYITSLENGWLRSFGVCICEDIRGTLIEYGLMSSDGRMFDGVSYTISQIKEKFGTLRWYASLDGDDSNAFAVEAADERIDLITSAYEILSSLTCVTCGTHDGVRFTRGWVVPMCYECYEGNERRYGRTLTKQEFVDDTMPGQLDAYRREGALVTVYGIDGSYRYDLLDRILGNGAPHTYVAELLGDVLGDDVCERYAERDYDVTLPVTKGDR